MYMKAATAALFAASLIASAPVLAQTQTKQNQEQPVDPATTSSTTTPNASIGISNDETAVITKGWSVKQNLIGANVYNDANEKIGDVSDVILAPDGSASFALLSVGGFLGIGDHTVVVPLKQVVLNGDKFVIAGATKEGLKALPNYAYPTK